MDIRGLVKILSNFIMNILEWLSQSSENRQANGIVCDTCWKTVDSRNAKTFFGGINVCPGCNNDIVEKYISTNPIKTLCPFCFDTKDSSVDCQYCNVRVKQNE